MKPLFPLGRDQGGRIKPHSLAAQLQPIPPLPLAEDVAEGRPGSRGGHVAPDQGPHVAASAVSLPFLGGHLVLPAQPSKSPRKRAPDPLPCPGYYDRGIGRPGRTARALGADVASFYQTHHLLRGRKPKPQRRRPLQKRRQQRMQGLEAPAVLGLHFQEASSIGLDIMEWVDSPMRVCPQVGPTVESGEAAAGEVSLHRDDVAVSVATSQASHPAKTQAMAPRTPPKDMSSPAGSARSHRGTWAGAPLEQAQESATVEDATVQTPREEERRRFARLGALIFEQEGTSKCSSEASTKGRRREAAGKRDALARGQQSVAQSKANTWALPKQRNRLPDATANMEKGAAREGLGRRGEGLIAAGLGKGTEGVGDGVGKGMGGECQGRDKVQMNVSVSVLAQGGRETGLAASGTGPGPRIETAHSGPSPSSPAHQALPLPLLAEATPLCLSGGAVEEHTDTAAQSSRPLFDQGGRPKGHRPRTAPPMKAQESSPSSVPLTPRTPSSLRMLGSLFSFSRSQALASPKGEQKPSAHAQLPGRTRERQSTCESKPRDLPGSLNDSPAHSGKVTMTPAQRQKQTSGRDCSTGPARKATEGSEAHGGTHGAEDKGAAHGPSHGVAGVETRDQGRRILQSQSVTAASQRPEAQAGRQAEAQAEHDDVSKNTGNGVRATQGGGRHRIISAMTATRASDSPRSTQRGREKLPGSSDKRLRRTQSAVAGSEVKLNAAQSRATQTEPEAEAEAGTKAEAEAGGQKFLVHSVNARLMKDIVSRKMGSRLTGQEVHGLARAHSSANPTTALSLRAPREEPSRPTPFPQRPSDLPSPVCRAAPALSGGQRAGTSLLPEEGGAGSEAERRGEAAGQETAPSGRTEESMAVPSGPLTPLAVEVGQEQDRDRDTGATNSPPEPSTVQNVANGQAPCVTGPSTQVDAEGGEGGGSSLTPALKKQRDVLEKAESSRMARRKALGMGDMIANQRNPEAVAKREERELLQRAQEEREALRLALKRSPKPTLSHSLGRGVWNESPRGKPKPQTAASGSGSRLSHRSPMPTPVALAHALRKGLLGRKQEVRTSKEDLVCVEEECCDGDGGEGGGVGLNSDLKSEGQPTAGADIIQVDCELEGLASQAEGRLSPELEVHGEVEEAQVSEGEHGTSALSQVSSWGEREEEGILEEGSEAVALSIWEREWEREEWECEEDCNEEGMGLEGTGTVSGQVEAREVGEGAIEDGCKARERGVVSPGEEEQGEGEERTRVPSPKGPLPSPALTLETKGASEVTQLWEAFWEEECWNDSL